jgi:hypothetical protein
MSDDEKLADTGETKMFTKEEHGNMPESGDVGTENSQANDKTGGISGQEESPQTIRHPKAARGL